MAFSLNYPNESQHHQVLHSLSLTDSLFDSQFNRITEVLATALHVPMAAVSLFDEDRGWFKAKVGLELIETPKDISFCSHVVTSNAPVFIEDATTDSRFAETPAVTGEPNIRFYAGVPIHSIDGFALGALCAIDSKPRVLTDEEVIILTTLAETVSKEIQLRESLLKTHKELTETNTMLKAAEEQLHEIFDFAGVGIALLSENAQWVRFNNAFCQITGYNQQELAKTTLGEITYPEDIGMDQHLRERILTGEIDCYEREKRYIQKNGKVIWVHLTVTCHKNDKDVPMRFIAIVKNIQERKEAEESLSELRASLEDQIFTQTNSLRVANEMLSSTLQQQVRTEKIVRNREMELSQILENANDAYVCINHIGLISEWNRQAELTFGWERHEAVGHKIEDLIIPPSLRKAHREGLKRYLSSGETKVLNQRIELNAVCKDGRQIPVEIQIKAMHFDEHTLFTAFLHDISKRKQLEMERERDARYDSLSGLMNRRALFEMLPLSIARAERHKNSFALIFLDLDGFKMVNDDLGHKAGDLLLQEVGARLRTSIRKTDTAFRLGGDEFTVVLENLKGDVQDAVMLSHKLLTEIQKPVSISESFANVSASIGISIYRPGQSITPDLLISRADSAMYSAKKSGKSRICISTEQETISSADS